VNVHRLQSSIEVGPNHWIVARPTRWGGYDVLEVTAGGSHLHSQHRRRHHAEVIAAAIAATRTHQPRKAHR